MLKEEIFLILISQQEMQDLLLWKLAFMFSKISSSTLCYLMSMETATSTHRWIVLLQLSSKSQEETYQWDCSACCWWWFQIIKSSFHHQSWWHTIWYQDKIWLLMILMVWCMDTMKDLLMVWVINRLPTHFIILQVTWTLLLMEQDSHFSIR